MANQLDYIAENMLYALVGLPNGITLGYNIESCDAHDYEFSYVSLDVKANDLY